jgi:hypothetical protein
MKKGQSGIPQWVVLLLLSIILTTMTGAVYYSIFVESQKSKTSFEDLIDKINGMKDGETLDYSLYMADSNLLISFVGGQDYQGPSSVLIRYWAEDCEQGDKIKISPSCGSYPCLCICETSFQGDYEKSCSNHALICHPFTTKQISFFDPTCPSVFKEGQSNGILQLHLQLKNNVLSFCENKDCIADRDTDAVAKFKDFIAQYQTCLNSQEPCSCNLDYTFLTEEYYALNFYSDRLELYDIQLERPIYSESFTTNIASSLPNVPFTNLISLYQFEQQDYYVPEAALTEGLKSFVVSTSLDDISVLGELSEKQIEVSTILLSKENKLYFTSEDLSQYPSCSIDKRVSL